MTFDTVAFWYLAAWWSVIVAIVATCAIDVKRAAVRRTGDANSGVMPGRTRVVPSAGEHSGQVLAGAARMVTRREG